MKISIHQEFDSNEILLLQSLINCKIESFLFNENERKEGNREIYIFSPASITLFLNDGTYVQFKIIHLYTMPELETQQLCVSRIIKSSQDMSNEIPINFKIKKIEIYSKPVKEILDYLYASEIFNKYISKCEDPFHLDSKTCQMLILYNEYGDRICIEANQYNGSSIYLSLRDDLVHKKVNSIYPPSSNPDYLNKMCFELQYSIT